MKTLLQIGAGKIGRSFIAQIFSKAGYRIIFADIDPCIVNILNEAGSYNVVFKKQEGDELFKVKDISAVEIGSESKMKELICQVDLISISVGKRSLLNLAYILSKGIKERYEKRPDAPLDIILAENVDQAASLLSSKIKEMIPEIPVDDFIGFVETNIEKVVPIMTSEQLKDDALMVYAEPYNALIVDKNGFRNAIPDIPDLLPKTKLSAWIDRKVFILYLGHATLAYTGNYAYPEMKYTWEVLAVDALKENIIATMKEAAVVLCHLHPEEFNMEELEKHILSLIERFGNKNLGDTIFRVGSDIGRKLGRDDRLLRPALTACSAGYPCEHMLDAWLKGCFFSARDDKGRMFSPDRRFREKYNDDPIRILKEHCKLDESRHPELFSTIKMMMQHLGIKTGTEND